MSAQLPPNSSNVAWVTTDEDMEIGYVEVTEATRTKRSAARAFRRWAKEEVALGLIAADEIQMWTIDLSTAEGECA